MKKMTVLFFFALITSASYAQIGIGLGSSGINIKTSAENKWRVIGRMNFSIGSYFVLFPEVNVVNQFINESQFKAYVGGGIGAVLPLGEGEGAPVYLQAPLGIEFFPLEGKNISVTIESGLRFIAEEENSRIGIPALFEFTFYLN